MTQKTPINLVESDSEFLEKVAGKVNFENGEEWMYMPFWYRKVGPGLYLEYSFEYLPEGLKEELAKLKL